MADIRGCNLPEDLYYLIEKHVWAKPMDDGRSGWPERRRGQTFRRQTGGGNIKAKTSGGSAPGQERSHGGKQQIRRSCAHADNRGAGAGQRPTG